MDMVPFLYVLTKRVKDLIVKDRVAHLPISCPIAPDEYATHSGFIFKSASSELAPSEARFFFFFFFYRLIPFLSSQLTRLGASIQNSQILDNRKARLFDKNEVSFNFQTGKSFRRSPALFAQRKNRTARQRETEQETLLINKEKDRQKRRKNKEK